MEPELRESGIGALYLFGSRARGDHRPDSDIDLLFDVSDAADAHFSLLDQTGLMVRLEEALGSDVDFVERRALRPRIRPHAEAEKVRIFG